MRIFMGDRGSGKTDAAIRWLCQDPESRVIAEPNMQAAQLVLDRARAIRPDLRAQCVQTIEQIVKTRKGVEVWIDELEACIHAVFEGRIKLAGTSVQVADSGVLRVEGSTLSSTGVQS